MSRRQNSCRTTYTIIPETALLLLIGSSAVLFRTYGIYQFLPEFIYRRIGLGRCGYRFQGVILKFYDIIVIDPANMVIHEGISLWDSSEEQVADGAQIAGFQDEIRKSLGLRDDRIGGWEGFFDSKQIERVEVADGRAGVFMQQMRLGVALAESGEKLKGCIHSVDVVWVERSLDDGKSGWQVRGRQQLYRDEIEARSFFRHVRMAELTGIRVGVREKRLDNIELK